MRPEDATSRSQGQADDTGLREQAAGGTLWTLSQTIGSRLATTLVFIVLARLLEPASFGLMALAAAIVSVMTLLVEQGFGGALIQRSTLERGHENAAFLTSLALGALLGAACLLGAGWLADAFDQPELAPVLRVLAFVPAVTALGSVPLALLSRQLRFRQMAIRTWTATAVSGVAAVTAAVAGLGVWALVIQLLTQVVVSSALLWILARWRPGVRTSRAQLGHLLKFSSSLLGMNLLNVCNRRSDDFLIGAVLGPVALGLYAVAYRVLLVMTDTLTRTISHVAYPLFCLVQDDRERLLRGYYSASQVSAAIAFPAFLMMAVTAPQVVPTLFGSQWDESIPVMQVLALIGMLHASLYFTRSALTAVGKPHMALILTATNAVGNVVAFVIAVRWGILAVAIAYVIRGYLLAPLPIVLMNRLLGLDIRRYLAGMAAPFAAAAAMTGSMFAAQQALDSVVPAAPLLAVLLALGTLVYLAALRLVGASLAAELWSLSCRVAPALSRLRLPHPLRAAVAGRSRA